MRSEKYGREIARLCESVCMACLSSWMRERVRENDLKEKRLVFYVCRHCFARWLMQTNTFKTAYDERETHTTYFIDIRTLTQTYIHNPIIRTWRERVILNFALNSMFFSHRKYYQPLILYVCPFSLALSLSPSRFFISHLFQINRCERLIMKYRIIIEFNWAEKKMARWVKKRKKLFKWQHLAIGILNLKTQYEQPPPPPTTTTKNASKQKKSFYSMNSTKTTTKKRNINNNTQ